MDKNEKLLNLKLQEGEGYLIEFKEKVSNNLDRELVAFANASGGEIYLGVADNGEITGIDFSNHLSSAIYDTARNCDPIIEIELIPYKSQKVVAIVIPEGINKPYKCKDGFYLRMGSCSQKLKRDEIILLINNSGKIHFDEAVNQRFKFPEDFSNEELTQYLIKCNIDNNFKSQDVLLSLNLVEETKEKFLLKNAAILFFAKKPQFFFPEAYITCVSYKSNDRFNILDKKDFQGTLIDQIEQSLEFVKRHINVATDFTNVEKGLTGAREDIYDYPLIAIREAIINAVVHRDYLYDGAHIYIHIYPNHIDIENPGGLYHGLNIDDLGKRSVRRNRLIADLLHRAGYIERIGSGFDRMRHALEINKNPPLEVVVSNFFNIRFYKREKDFDLTQLTTRQMAIYQLFHEQAVLTKREISIALKISEDTVIRELKTLLNSGIILKIGTGRSTRYHLENNPAFKTLNEFKKLVLKKS